MFLSVYSANPSSKSVRYERETPLDHAVFSLESRHSLPEVTVISPWLHGELSLESRYSIPNITACLQIVTTFGLRLMPKRIIINPASPQKREAKASTPIHIVVYGRCSGNRGSMKQGLKNWVLGWLLGDRVVPARSCALPRADNDNCFWRWLLGPYPPFESAKEMRNRLARLRSTKSSYFADDKAYLISECTLFLELFRCVYVEQNLDQARKLAPKLNQTIPQLMMHCPEPDLRPTQAQLLRDYRRNSPSNQA